MTGMTNYSADNVINYLTGQANVPALPAVFLALFTAVGTDAGTGFTEVSGGAYARVQIAGTLTIGTAQGATGTTLTFASVPSWIVAGMTVFCTNTTSRITAGTTVVSTTATTVVISAATNSVTTTSDIISFSTFLNGTGTAPSNTNNNSVIGFAAATANWGTVVAFGLYDASSAGNLLWWDFMGNFAWLPFEATTASGSQLAVKANGYASNDPVVFTAEYGGTLPTMSTGVFTSYTVNFVATPATDTINVDTTSGPATPIVLTSTGSGMVRKIVQQSIPSGVTASFAASSMTLTLA